MPTLKKIIIVSPSLKLGGIERALTVLASEFVKKGVEVHFISCLKGKHFYKLPSSINLYEPSFGRKSGIIDKILYYPKLVCYLRKTTQKIDPQCVLVFGDWFSPLTLLALWNANIPVFISDRTLPEYKFKFPIPLLKNILYPTCSGFIAQTSRAKHYKESVFDDKLRIEVIPNALPQLQTFSNTIKEDVILFVGRFAWEKDPEILIRAMAIILEKHHSWKLHMAGSGPLLSSMKELVIELKIEHAVVFLGNVENVGKLYQESKILILPSVVEGFPNTLIEAMSFGLPCICFQDIPYEDIVTDQIDALVVKERTSRHLANAAQTLIQKEDFRLQIGMNSLKSVRRFEKEKIAQQLLTFMKI